MGRESDHHCLMTAMATGRFAMFNNVLITNMTSKDQFKNKIEFKAVHAFGKETSNIETIDHLPYKS